MKRKRLWRNDGGGTCLIGNSKYPSDVTFTRDLENNKGYEEVEIVCDTGTYFDMPEKIEDVTSLVDGKNSIISKYSIVLTFGLKNKNTKLPNIKVK